MASTRLFIESAGTIFRHTSKYLVVVLHCSPISIHVVANKVLSLSVAPPAE